MRKSYNIVVISVFLAFIGLFFVLNMALPDREFSSQENRYLQQSPEFNLKALADGKFTTDFESYVTDQFTFRDTWTTLKAVCERMTGKQENKGFYYGENGHLLEEFTAPSKEEIRTRVEYVNTLSENVDVPVSLMLIPGAADVQAELLPANAPTDSQRTVIEEAYAAFDGPTVDVVSVLDEHNDEYIFYRTDHHWTSLGAYYGFAALCDTWALPCPDLSSYERETVSNDFYGTSYSGSGFSWLPPDSMEIFVPEDGRAVVKAYDKEDPEQIPMYDRSFLELKDKYSMFFGGNTPHLDIDTGREGERLLILRDSYCDSLTPFLLDSFSHITMLDMRYFKTSVADFARAMEIDRILVVYSVENFCEDENLFMMTF